MNEESHRRAQATTNMHGLREAYGGTETEGHAQASRGEAPRCPSGLVRGPPRRREARAQGPRPPKASRGQRARARHQRGRRAQGRRRRAEGSPPERRGFCTIYRTVFLFRPRSDVGLTGLIRMIGKSILSHEAVVFVLLVPSDSM